MAQGTVARSLAGISRAYSAIQSRLYGAPKDSIAGIDPSGWPSPGQPVRPNGGPGAEPLLFSYYTGSNLNITPRSDEDLTFQDLRSLATYPLARICIENVKDQILSLPWSIQLREKAGQSIKDRKAAQQKDKIIPMLTDFFSYPDGETPWKDWGRRLLEDRLVIDAASILVRRTFGGDVAKLHVLDGADILRLIDQSGGTPAAPSMAYVQLWDNIPRVGLTTDQLVYRPANIVPRGTLGSQLYGYSPVEQMAQEIQIGQERLRYVQSFYTEGAVPGVIHLIGPDVPPDRIKEGMAWQQSELAGNYAARRQVRPFQSYTGSVADGPKDQIIQLKEPVLGDQFDEMHIRKIAFAFGASAQRLLKAMNRASAEEGQSASEEEGHLPIITWLKGTIDLIIQRRMGHADYEINFDLTDELDPSLQAKILNEYVTGGVMTRNEARDKMGLEGSSDPEANELMITLTTGVVPLAGSIDRTNAQHEADIAPPPTPIIHNGPQPVPAPGAKKPEKPARPAPKPTSSKKKLSKRNAVTISSTKLTAHISLATARMHTVLSRFFFNAAKRIKLPVEANKLVKASDQYDPDAIVDDIMAEIGWDDLSSQVEPDLHMSALEGATFAIQDLKIVSDDVIAEINSVAASYAKDRAAAMVGMKWVDGRLVTNPNAKFPITDTTREMLRRDVVAAFGKESTMEEIEAQIKQSGAFSDTRAQLIAKTEVQQAQVAGNFNGWVESGVAEEAIWVLSGDHDRDDECDENAAAGPVKLGEPFPSGDLHPLAHPRCNCGMRLTKIDGVEV